MNALLKHTPVMPILPVPTLTDPSFVSATGGTLGMDLIVLVRNSVYYARQNATHKAVYTNNV